MGEDVYEKAFTIVHVANLKMKCHWQTKPLRDWADIQRVAV
jgi:hypothetical protein